MRHNARTEGCIGRINAGLFVIVALLQVCAPNVEALTAGSNVTTSVVLDRDLVADGYSVGLRVQANNITIDGNGYSLTCSVRTANVSSVGILVNGYSNVTIKNFRKISGFIYGLDLRASAGIAVVNSRIEANVLAGIRHSNGGDLRVENCFFKEIYRGVEFSSGTGMVLAGNTFYGGKEHFSIFGAQPVTSIVNNRFLHQINESPALRRFGSMTQRATAGQNVAFSVSLSTLTGEQASTVACAIRTIPAETVVLSRNGSVVTGTFVPSRNGYYSVVAEAADAHGNRSEGTAKVNVGPTAERTVTYYPYGWNEGPFHGPGSSVANDSAGMYKTPPAKPNYFFCGSWVDWYVDALPSTPMASISRIQVKNLFRADYPWFVDKLSATYSSGVVGGSRSLSIPSSYMTGNIEWGEFSFNGLDWTLNYPQDWYYVKMTYSAMMPKIYTGDPAYWGHPKEHLSQTKFDYTATVSPEVRVVSNPDVLLLGATRPTTGLGGETLTVWGANDQADLTVANFRRPFLDCVTQIAAVGEAVFNSGVVNGERTFEAVPLEVQPTLDAVRVQVVTWPVSGNGVRQWTEAAVGAPGSVSHTLSGLLPFGSYRITVNGSQLADRTADQLGRVSFVYDGTFPATIGVSLVPPNSAPNIVSAPWAVPNPVVLPGSTSVSVVASDLDGLPAPLTYTWSKESGLGTVTFTPNGTTASGTSTVSFGQAGTYSLKVIVSDGAASVTDRVTVTVNAAPLAPVITTQPASVTVSVGQPALFNVAATGSGPLTYQWRKNGIGISGATSSTYQTPETTAVDNGARFSVAVSNGAGSVISSTAVLTIADTMGPVLEVGSAVLKGTVNDAGGLASLKVNGATVEVGAGGTWQTEVPLTGAMTTVTLSATDAAGNITNKTLTVGK